MSTSQRGSIELIIIAVLVVALIGAVGYIGWQKLTQKSASSTGVSPTSQQTGESGKKAQGAQVSDDIETQPSQPLSLILNSRKITLDVTDSKYTDLVAVPDEVGPHYDIYSKDLLARVNKSNGRATGDLDGCNSTVSVYVYDKTATAVHVNSVGEANGKSVHVGFSGPCEPSVDEALSAEMIAFRDYIVAKVTSSLK